MPESPPTVAAVFTELDRAQADGLACIVCGLNYLDHGDPHVPVGRSQTGSQVFACEEQCAPKLGHQLPLQPETHRS